MKELAKHSAIFVDLAVVRMQSIAPGTAGETVAPAKEPLNVPVALFVVLLAGRLTLTFVPNLLSQKAFVAEAAQSSAAGAVHIPCQLVVVAEAAQSSAAAAVHIPWPPGGSC